RGSLRVDRERHAVTQALLSASNLVKTFPVGGGLFGSSDTVHALSDVSFTLDAGETLAVVGESGCGKSTLARSLVGLTDLTGGALVVDGRDSREFLTKDSLGFHRFIQIVFQDPQASLNPRRT